MYSVNTVTSLPPPRLSELHRSRQKQKMWNMLGHARSGSHNEIEPLPLVGDERLTHCVHTSTESESRSTHIGLREHAASPTGKAMVRRQNRPLTFSTVSGE